MCFLKYVYKPEPNVEKKNSSLHVVMVVAVKDFVRVFSCSYGKNANSVTYNRPDADHQYMCPRCLLLPCTAAGVTILFERPFLLQVLSN